MAKKLMSWKTKGMNQDLSVSAFNPEFAFENMNLRLSTNEGNTLLSWVNEKGTKKITIKQNNTEVILKGTAIGTTVLNHTLVVFTTSYNGVDDKAADYKGDYIYKLEYSNADTPIMKMTTLYEGNLEFDKLHPIETVTNYESETVQKVYWVDGKNQPRIINIAVPDETISKWISSDYNAWFDFISELRLEEKITIEKLTGTSGMFAPGVIQYAFTYYNKYGQESNIFYTSPLLYISYADRGASPESKVENAFKIKIKNVDENFEYLRIYSIQRTSINSTPLVKRIQDIEIKKLSGATGEKIASYVDTGFSGDSVDPTELLYKGGEAIVVDTLEQKDDTLFLGGISTQMEHFSSEMESDIKNACKGISSGTRKFTVAKVSDGVYKYYNQLTAKEYSEETDPRGLVTVPCAGFKRGDFYRCGVQFQYKTGRWSAPIYIENAIVSNHPDINEKDGIVTVPILTGQLADGPDGLVKKIMDAGYKRIRAVVVYPEMKDRITICQGVLNPTMYTTEHRIGTGDAITPRGDVYAQSSWFFRPNWSSNDYVSNGGAVVPACPDNEYPIDYIDRTNDGNPFNERIRRVEIQGRFNGNNQYRVDKSQILTLHSPDAEFDTQLSVLNFSDTYYRTVGTVNFTGALSDISIQTETPVISNVGSGFIHKAFSLGGVTSSSGRNVTTRNEGGSINGDDSNDSESGNIDSGNPSEGTGTVESSEDVQGPYGIVSGLFYDDYITDDMGTGGSDDTFDHFERYEKENSSVKWMVYLWNKDGSLNNDINRPSDKGTPSSILKKKVVSNLRVAKTVYGESPREGIKFISSPQLFLSDEPTILKVNGKIYQGNVDSILTPDGQDGVYFAIGKRKKVDDDEYVRDDTIESQLKETAFYTTDMPQWYKTGSEDDYSLDRGYGLYEYDGTGAWELMDGGEKEMGSGVVLEKPCYNVGKYYFDLIMKRDIVRMKYKSTPHIVGFFQSGIISEAGEGNLPIVEITRYVYNPQADLFGGESMDALKENIWIPCGEPVTLEEGKSIPFFYDYGDTYYQRYDCLKTYPFTPEDKNQVVEIGSFMLETRVNIDGRYDRNRGQLSNLNMTPRNFNLINPVYSQINNFFTYRIMDDSYYENTQFPNQITWSKTKQSGADVDQWTNVTLASVLELDGDKGKLNKLIRLNDQLLAFQDTGISQILYNDNVQISSTDGVPIEIANSGKVQGKRYLSNTIGCSNKWSMATTPNGIYFMDSHDKGIYLFNGQLNNISNTGGFNTWCKKTIPLTKDGWKPDFSDKEFVAYYDKLNQDVLFINKDKALAWSEKLQAFTSFYDYGGIPFFCNLDDTGIWIKNGESGVELWKHQGGDYCRFFDKNKPYWMTLVGNPEPQTDKIFTNLEFRACVQGDGTTKTVGDKTEFDKFLLPFDSLETWDEYQHGIAKLNTRTGHDLFKHHLDNTTGDGASVIRKFRMWRCDIPRDNTPKTSDQTEQAAKQNGYSLDTALGITRYSRKPQDRMRNPWIYLKLMKKAETGTHTVDGQEVPNTLPKAEVHDLIMTYFN